MDTPATLTDEEARRVVKRDEQRARDVHIVSRWIEEIEAEGDEYLVVTDKAYGFFGVADNKQRGNWMAYHDGDEPKRIAAKYGLKIEWRTWHAEQKKGKEKKTGYTSVS